MKYILFEHFYLFPQIFLELLNIGWTHNIIIVPINNNYTGNMFLVSTVTINEWMDKKSKSFYNLFKVNIHLTVFQSTMFLDAMTVTTHFKRQPVLQCVSLFPDLPK